MGDDWFNDLLGCFIEREIFSKINDKRIMVHFHALKEYRGGKRWKARERRT